MFLAPTVGLEASPSTRQHRGGPGGGSPRCTRGSRTCRHGTDSGPWGRPWEWGGGACQRRGAEGGGRPNSGSDQRAGARGGGGRAARSIGGRTEARRSTAPFLGQRPAASRGADGPLSSVLTTCGARASSPLGAASAEDATARCGGPVQRPPFPGVSRREPLARGRHKRRVLLSLSSRGWARWSRLFLDSGRPAAQGGGAGPGQPTQPPATVDGSLALRVGEPLGQKGVRGRRLFQGFPVVRSAGGRVGVTLGALSGVATGRGGCQGRSPVLGWPCQNDRSPGPAGREEGAPVHGGEGAGRAAGGRPTADPTGPTG